MLFDVQCELECGYLHQAKYYLLGVYFPKPLHICTSSMKCNLRDRVDKSNHLHFLLYLGGKMVNCLCKIYISKYIRL